MNKNREIEAKLMVETPGLTFQEVCEEIQYMLTGISTFAKEGRGTDIYWNAPKKSGLDFIRLRDDHIITVKKSDRGNNFNRAEVNCKIASIKEPSEALLSLILGEPKGALTTIFSCWNLTNTEQGHGEVSVYQVVGSDKIFIEVEAPTERAVIFTIKKIMKSHYLNFSVVKNTVKDIFIDKKRLKSFKVEKSYNNNMLSNLLKC